MRKEFFLLPLILPLLLYAHPIREKVLLCGVGKNIEQSLLMTRLSMERVSLFFEDYQIVIYENNSTDRTKELLCQWQEENPRLLLLSETLTEEELSPLYPGTKGDALRVEHIARARNKLLGEIIKPIYDDFKYVIMADLDFQTPWDFEEIANTILSPPCEWDAVFAYSVTDEGRMYDLFAYRAPDYPIGFELVGEAYFSPPTQLFYPIRWGHGHPWHKVYSAFGGLALYKREAIKHSSYSPFITKEVSQLCTEWLKESREDSLYHALYTKLLNEALITDLTDDFLAHRSFYPALTGLRIPEHNSPLVWFSSSSGGIYPWTCEHISFHASMISHGYDKLYINPNLRLSYFLW